MFLPFWVCLLSLLFVVFVGACLAFVICIVRLAYVSGFGLLGLLFCS